MPDKQNDDLNDFTYEAYANEDYCKYLDIWRRSNDCIEGSWNIKNASVNYDPANPSITTGTAYNPYLPPNAWQKKNPADYHAYKNFAVYYAYATDTLNAQLGMLGRGEPTIELPKAMDFFRDDATVYNDGLKQLQRRINQYQLAFGRYHLLLEVNDNPNMPDLYINEFIPQKFLRAGMETRNGETYARFILLDASTMVFNYETKKDEQLNQLLVLGLDENDEYYQQIIHPDKWEEFNVMIPSAPTYPELKKKRLNRIPFTAVNASNLKIQTYEMPPLYDLCELTLSLYRLNADYYQTLHMTGQDTIVISGGEYKGSSIDTGAGAFINLKNPNMKAEYIGVSGSGLASQQQEVKEMHIRCQQKGVSLVDLEGNQSGKALETIQGAQTASLQVVNSTSGDAITEQLNYAKTWISLSNANIEDVIIYQPSQEFADSKLTMKELLELWQIKMQGAPISNSSYHKVLKENGITDKELEEEEAEIIDNGGSVDVDDE